MEERRDETPPPAPNGHGEGRDTADAPDTHETELLLGVLPGPIREALREVRAADLLEIVLDLGRPVEARLAGRTVRLPELPVAAEDLAHVLGQLGAMGEDNRAGIERTLHRISAIRNRRGQVIGLTLRVGRAIFGTIDMLRDLIESGRNLLLLGRPGVGKTTKLREVARVLADDLGRRVIVIDTSNEIGGDGDVPHPGIGGARRMQVARPDQQHAVMIEAVENHMPEVIIVDEIGTAAEAAAARTIAERGVQLIGTAHGTTLENLVLNPTLSDLVGGVHTVTLSDEEARRRGTQKTITERRGPPTFDCVVQIVDRGEVLAHRDTAEAVDRLLAGQPIGGERRRLVEGALRAEAAAPATLPPVITPPAPRPQGPPGRPGRASPGSTLRIYAHALSADLLRRVVDDLGVAGRVVETPEAADVILTLRAREGDGRLRRPAREGVPIHRLKKNSSTEMRRILRDLFGVVGGIDEEEVREAITEVEHAIARVASEGQPVALAPRRPELRKVQHRLVARYHLEAVSTGSEPMRHLIIYPDDNRPMH